ncbi:hypothetical protein C27AD_12356 [Salinisphaera hydrothermalis C27AD]
MIRLAVERILFVRYPDLDRHVRPSAIQVSNDICPDVRCQRNFYGGLDDRPVLGRNVPFDSHILTEIIRQFGTAARFGDGKQFASPRGIDKGLFAGQVQRCLTATVALRIVLEVPYVHRSFIGDERSTAIDTYTAASAASPGLSDMYRVTLGIQTPGDLFGRIVLSGRWHRI